MITSELDKLHDYPIVSFFSFQIQFMHLFIDQRVGTGGIKNRINCIHDVLIKMDEQTYFVPSAAALHQRNMTINQAKKVIEKLLWK